MLFRIFSSTVICGLALGAGSAAWAAGAPLQGTAKPAVVQPSTSSGEAMPPADVPPPARPSPAKKRSFFAGPGLGLLVAGAGAGTAVAVSSDDEPASP